MTETAETKAAQSGMGMALRLGGGACLTIFGGGIAKGVFDAWQEHGEARTGVVVGLSLAVAAMGIGIWLALSALRSGHYNVALPNSPRMRRSRILTYVCLAIGLISGIASHFIPHSSESGADLSDMHHGPIGKAAAIALLVGWLVGMAVSIYWHMTLDEIERAEYEFGALAAFYGYVTIAPAWWVAWRGGMLPEPDGIAIFFGVLIIWCIGWAWRRWR